VIRATLCLCTLVVVACAHHSSAPIVLQPRVQASAPLPPAAQQALDSGITAARAGDVALAIQRFNEARELAPGAAIVYLNLGVVEARIPNRELRAIAWFGAYLALYPDAPNAAEVAAEIEVLETRTRANIALLIEGEQNAISMLPAPWRDSWLESLATLHARVGDSTAANRVIGLMRDDSQAKAHINIAWAEARGRVAVARAQIRSGNVSAARDTLSATREIVARIDSGLYMRKIEAALALADAQARAGDVTGTVDVFAMAEEVAEGIGQSGEKSKYLIAIGAARFKTGDTSRGRVTFERARSAARQASGAWERDRQLSDLAIRQAEVGDLSAARETANSFEHAYEAWSAISKAEGRSGDYSSAAKTAAVLPADYRSETQSALADLARDAGDLDGARKFLEAALKSAHDGGRCCKARSLVRAAEAQLNAGDLAGAAKTLQSARDAADKVEWNKATGLTGPGSNRKTMQAFVAREVARLRDPAVAASDWLDKLEDRDVDHPCPLGSPPFLELAATLKGIPMSDDPGTLLGALDTTTARIIVASETLREALEHRLGKRQSQRR
jgi:tetratricopeptide (TPR) repeat protein